MLALAGEDRDACVEFSKNAAEGPHIDSCGIWDSENDLRSAVETRLDVSVDAFVREAGGPKVDNLDARLLRALQEDVFGLQVAVNHVLFSKVL